MATSKMYKSSSSFCRMRSRCVFAQRFKLFNLSRNLPAGMVPGRVRVRVGLGVLQINSTFSPILDAEILVEKRGAAPSTFEWVTTTIPQQLPLKIAAYIELQVQDVECSYESVSKIRWVRATMEYGLLCDSRQCTIGTRSVSVI